MEAGIKDQRPQAPFGRRDLEVTQVEQVGPYLILRCADPVGPVPAPGQFYMLASSSGWGGGEDGRPFLPRAFSVLRVLRQSGGVIELEFLLEAVGPGTTRLAQMGPGETLAVNGPFGNGFGDWDQVENPILVGGGIGVAPLLILSDLLMGKLLNGEGQVLLGFRTQDQAKAADLFGPAVSVATDDGSSGHHGFVTDLLSQQLAVNSSGSVVFACGPPAMLELVRQICIATNVPSQLALESGMACGFGACFGCVVPTRTGYLRLCLDGPVIVGDQLDCAIVAGAGH